MTEFIESGMSFKLSDDNCFRIEEHKLVRKTVKHSTQNLKACEFVSYVNNRHVFVEAKSSAPKGPAGKVEDLKLNGKSMPANWTAYDNFTSYLRDITKKFVDSYNILRSISEGYHGAEEKGELKLPNKNISSEKIEFVLILNLPSDAGNTKRESLANLRDALTNEMRPFLSIWNISSDAIKVCWPEQACARYGFPA
ncbi:MAG: hypothetical protein HDT06_00895 [Bacteroidales bacterium]|nr:hypothetical protein [Bacteroidales bacterium]